MLTLPLLKPSFSILVPYSLEQGQGTFTGMASGHRGDEMSSRLLIWIVKEITIAPDSLFSTKEKCSQWPPGWILVLIWNPLASRRRKRFLFLFLFSPRISSLTVRWGWQIFGAQTPPPWSIPPSSPVEPGPLLQGSFGDLSLEGSLPSCLGSFYPPFFLEICNLSMALFFSSEILEIVLFFGSMRLLQFTRKRCAHRARSCFQSHLRNKSVKSRVSRGDC